MIVYSGESKEIRSLIDCYVKFLQNRLCLISLYEDHVRGFLDELSNIQYVIVYSWESREIRNLTDCYVKFLKNRLYL